MGSASNLKLEPARLKHFFTHCSLAAKKISEKKKLKSEFSERLNKLKEMSAQPKTAKKSPEIISEIEKLEKRVADLIEIHVKEKSERNELIKKLEESIRAVQPKQNLKEFRDFERISSRLNENANKLSRVGEAEKKIEKEVQKEKSELDEIESKLENLEKKYREMSKSVKNKKELEKIKSMIDKHKKTLKNIKQKSS